MTQIFVQLLIIIVMFIVQYCITFLAKKNPEMIAGFRWSDTLEGVERDRRWLQLFHRSMSLSAAITLAGGILSVLVGSDILFMAFMMLPVSIASVCAAVNAPSKKKTALRHKRMKTVVAISTALLVIVPFVYLYAKDLEVVLGEDRMKIEGIYETEIRYDDILQIEECRILPNLSFRSNGLGLGSVRIGYFVTQDGITVKLFTHSDSCFIFIKDKKGNSFYMSKKNIEDTAKLYEEILLRVHNREQ